MIISEEALVERRLLKSEENGNVVSLLSGLGIAHCTSCGNEVSHRLLHEVKGDEASPRSSHYCCDLNAGCNDVRISTEHVAYAMIEAAKDILWSVVGEEADKQAIHFKQVENEIESEIQLLCDVQSMIDELGEQSDLVKEKQLRQRNIAKLEIAKDHIPQAPLANDLDMAWGCTSVEVLRNIKEKNDLAAMRQLVSKSFEKIGIEKLAGDSAYKLHFVAKNGVYREALVDNGEVVYRPVRSDERGKLFEIAMKRFSRHDAK